MSRESYVIQVTNASAADRHVQRQRRRMYIAFFFTRTYFTMRVSCPLHCDLM